MTEMQQRWARARKVFVVTYYRNGAAFQVLEQFARKRLAVRCAAGLVNAGFPANVRRVR